MIKLKERFSDGHYPIKSCHIYINSWSTEIHVNSSDAAILDVLLRILIAEVESFNPFPFLSLFPLFEDNYNTEGIVF